MRHCTLRAYAFRCSFVLFFFNDTATTEIYTLSLHDALPISPSAAWVAWARIPSASPARSAAPDTTSRSEEHTSELQSPCNLVCRLLLEKKKKKTQNRVGHGLRRLEC